MVAYLKGVHLYNDGKTDRNVKIIAKYTELDEGLLDEIVPEEMFWDQSFLDYANNELE